MTKGVVSGGGGWPPSGVSQASHKHFVVVVCKQWTTDAAVSPQLDACRSSLRLYLSHFATRTVDDTVDLYAAKPDIRPESHFLPAPPAFDAPVRGVPVGISPSLSAWKTRMAGLPTMKKFQRYLYSFWRNTQTWQTDGQTPHDGIGRAYA